jgi:hypothetical protein
MIAETEDTMNEIAPRREDIRGIVVDLPDLSDWKEAAKALKIKPFYSGPDAKPFSCLLAFEVRPDPPVVRDGKSFNRVNDFRLTPECQ